MSIDSNCNTEIAVHRHNPFWAPIACSIALIVAVVLLILWFVPANDQARVLEGLLIGGTLVVLISRALGI